MPHMFANAAEKKRRAIEKLAAAKPKKTRKKHAIAVVRDEARRVQEANDNQDKARGTGGRRTRRRTRRSRRTTK
jgi:hypothetical protein